jgi:hypothetical protein
MFERFNTRARRTVVLAQEEARMLAHNYIGTEHILLGLIHEGEGVAAKTLESLGISLDAVRRQVEEIIGRGQQAPSGHIPFTPRSKKVLTLSLQEALQLGHNYVGTEHILLGLIHEGAGVAAQILPRMGADPDGIRQQVMDLLSRYGRSEPNLTWTLPWNAAQPPRTPEDLEHVTAVQKDILHQIIHNLRNNDEFHMEDARRLARDFLALQLGTEPVDMADKLSSLSDKYPEIEDVWSRHLQFCMLLAGIYGERAEEEAAVNAQDFERAAAARDHENELLTRKTEWPSLYPNLGSDATNSEVHPGLRIAQYAEETSVKVSGGADQTEADPEARHELVSVRPKQSLASRAAEYRFRSRRTDFADLDLVIRKLDRDSYATRVLNSPAGETAEVPFHLPWSELELENFLLRIAYRPRSVRRLDTPQIATIKDFGSRLYRALFTDQIEAILLRSLSEAAARGVGLRIRLRLTDAPVLGALPWEFMYDGLRNRFLCLSERTPIVRFLDVPDPQRPLNISGALRILVMISSPTDLGQLDTEQEWGRLSAALAPLVQDNAVYIHRLERGTLAGLRRALRQQDWNVLHFIGHGGFDTSIGDGVLAFEDDQRRSRLVSGQDLGILLHDHDSLRLVVLNSCEGGRADNEDPFSGSAQGLMQQGIPAIVAMQFEISDGAAITLASEMYGAICDGYSLEAAVGAARKAIFTDGNQTEWATPVIYLRTGNGIIFNVLDRE